MALRYRAPEGTAAVCFGPGCNTPRQVVDGLLDCPLGASCGCRRWALEAGFAEVERSGPETRDVRTSRTSDARPARRRRARKAPAAPSR